MRGEDVLLRLDRILKKAETGDAKKEDFDQLMEDIRESDIDNEKYELTQKINKLKIALLSNMDAKAGELSIQIAQTLGDIDNENN